MVITITKLRGYVISSRASGSFVYSAIIAVLRWLFLALTGC